MLYEQYQVVAKQYAKFFDPRMKLLQRIIPTEDVSKVQLIP